MKAEAFEAHLSALKGAQLCFPFGPDVAVYKIGGKMFALIQPAGNAINLKNDPAENEMLRMMHPGITPGYHMNKRHWNTVDLETVDETLVLELILESYRIVMQSLPKAMKEALSDEQHD